MIRQTFILQKYHQNGEKTGWTFIEFEPELVELLNPKSRTSFRVKGSLDDLQIQQMAMIPVGDSYFILSLKAEIRKKIGKEEGQSVFAQLELDSSELIISEDLMACMEDEPEAKAFFDTLTPGHQRYFSNWIESAKTTETKGRRISQAIFGFYSGWTTGK